MGWNFGCGQVGSISTFCLHENRGEQVERIENLTATLKLQRRIFGSLEKTVPEAGALIDEMYLEGGT
jgi:hypothetical protein